MTLSGWVTRRRDEIDSRSCRLTTLSQKNVSSLNCLGTKTMETSVRTPVSIKSRPSFPTSGSSRRSSTALLRHCLMSCIFAVDLPSQDGMGAAEPSTTGVLYGRNCSLGAFAVPSSTTERVTATGGVSPCLQPHQTSQLHCCK